MNRRSFWKGLLLAPVAMLAGKSAWPWSGKEETIAVPLSVLANAARAAKACQMFDTPFQNYEAKELLEELERLGKFKVIPEKSGYPVRADDIAFGWNLVVY